MSDIMKQIVQSRLAAIRDRENAPLEPTPMVSDSALRPEFDGRANSYIGTFNQGLSNLVSVMGAPEARDAKKAAEAKLLEEQGYQREQDTFKNKLALDQEERLKEANRLSKQANTIALNKAQREEEEMAARAGALRAIYGELSSFNTNKAESAATYERLKSNGAISFNTDSNSWELNKGASKEDTAAYNNWIDTGKAPIKDPNVLKEKILRDFPKLNAADMQLLNGYIDKAQLEVGELGTLSTKELENQKAHLQNEQNKAMTNYLQSNGVSGNVRDWSGKFAVAEQGATPFAMSEDALLNNMTQYKPENLGDFRSEVFTAAKDAINSDKVLSEKVKDKEFGLTDAEQAWAINEALKSTKVDDSFWSAKWGNINSKDFGANFKRVIMDLTAAKHHGRVLQQIDVDNKNRQKVLEADVFARHGLSNVGKR